ncbi:MAG: PilW family protein [Nitrospirales bacterium]
MNSQRNELSNRGYAGPAFRPHQGGFSLIEVMFGVLISMIVIAGGYTVMTSSEQAANINDQTAQMQQSARIAMELISRDLQTAGFGIDGAVGGCATPIVPQDHTSTGADTGPDSVDMVVPSNLGTLALQFVGSPTANQFRLSPAGTVTAMAAEGFGVGSSVSINGAVTGTVSTVAAVTDDVTISNTLAAPATFPAGTPVYWLRCTRYDIATSAAACSGNAPCLRRGVVPGGVTPPTMVPIAEGIEDLQLAYACDGCGGAVPDGIIDDQNASNTFDDADFLSNTTWTAAPQIPESIRLVRLSVVARQLRSDPWWQSTAPIRIEDHDHQDDAGFDQQTYKQFRRRLFTRTVEVRNIGLE